MQVNGGVCKTDEEEVVSQKPEKKKKRRRKVKDYDWNTKPSKKNAKKKLDSSKKMCDETKASENDESYLTALDRFMFRKSTLASSNTNSNNATHLNQDADIDAKLSAAQKKRKRAVSPPHDIRDRTKTRPRVHPRTLTEMDDSTDEDASTSTLSDPHSNGTFLGLGPQAQSSNKLGLFKSTSPFKFAKPWISDLASSSSDRFTFSGETAFEAMSCGLSRSLKNEAKPRFFSNYRDMTRSDDDDQLTSSSSTTTSSDEMLAMTSSDESVSATSCHQSSTDSSDCDADVVTCTGDRRPIGLKRDVAFANGEGILTKPILGKPSDCNSFGLGAIKGGLGMTSEMGGNAQKKRGRPRRRALAVNKTEKGKVDSGETRVLASEATQLQDSGLVEGTRKENNTCLHVERGKRKKTEAVNLEQLAGSVCREDVGEEIHDQIMDSCHFSSNQCSNSSASNPFPSLASSVGVNDLLASNSGSSELDSRSCVVENSVIASHFHNCFEEKKMTSRKRSDCDEMAMESGPSDATQVSLFIYF